MWPRYILNCVSLQQEEICHEIHPPKTWTWCQNIVCGNILCGILKIRRLQVAEFEYLILFVSKNRERSLCFNSFCSKEKRKISPCTRTWLEAPVAEPKSFSQLSFRNQLWSGGKKFLKCLSIIQKINRKSRRPTKGGGSEALVCTVAL